MLSLQQKQEVSAKVKHYVELANNRLGSNMGLPNIKYNLTGTTAGTARGDYELNFNAQLLVDNWELYFEDTIPHEVAHLIDYRLNGNQYKYTRRGTQRISHGVTWKNIMRQLGVNPTRTHNMDVSKTAKPKQKFIYVCECCKEELTLTSIRHNKLLRNPAQYTHCRGSKLTFKTALGKVTYAEAAQMKNTKKAPVAPKTSTPKATKKTVAPKTGVSIAQRVTNLYKRAHIENPAVTRKEIIIMITKEFNLDADPKGKMKASNYYTTAKLKASK